MSGGSVADATGNWVDTLAPAWLKPYLRLARLDRPIGSWLLLLPCWWSAALASALVGDVSRLPLILALFFVGAFAMRGAGCTWNDITDRDLDAKVERTRSRPIPAGQVSGRQAGGFLVGRAVSRPGVLLGRADGICGDARADRCHGACALRRRDRLGDRLRHHLCASGRRGRR